MIEISVTLHEDDRPLSPNRKLHHMSAYIRNKKLKQAIRYAFISNRFDLRAREMILECQGSLKVILCLLGPKLKDFDNLVASLKASVDICADVLLPGRPAGRADGDPRLKFEYAQEVAKKHELKITIISDCEVEKEAQEKLSSSLNPTSCKDP